MTQTRRAMPYTNETHIAVTCRECGYRWQMTYGDLQHARRW